MSEYSNFYQGLIQTYLHRDWKFEDGMDENEILGTESRLKLKLPHCLRELYLTIGNEGKLLSIHNKVRALKEIEIEDNYLVFMDENQNVVSWGINLNDIGSKKPEVWQKNNTESIWYSEEKNLQELLVSMLEWYLLEEILL